MLTTRVRALIARVTLFVAWLRCRASLADAYELSTTGLSPVTGGTLTNFATGATEAVNRWAEKIWIEAARTIYWAPFFSERSEDAIIEVKSDFEKNPGEKMYFSLNRKLAGAGVSGDNTLEGNEEALTVYTDSVTIDQRRNAVRLQGRMSEQRTMFDQRKLARTQLKTWMAEYIDDSIFTNMDSSPTTVIYGGDATSTATIDSTDTLSLTTIAKAVAKAKKAAPKIHPVMVGGKPYYVVVVHTDVAYDLKTGTSAGTWQDLSKYAAARGADNGIFTGAMGMYEGAIIHEHEKIPTTTTWGSGSNVAGASNFFLGRQAGLFAWGRKPDAWEQVFDYGNSVGFAIGAIFAFRKAVFNSVDFAAVALRTARTNN